MSHSESGLKPRAAHTAIYVQETDSLYIFGGYDLNYILSDLEVYRFSTSQWEDEYGTVLGKHRNQYTNFVKKFDISRIKCIAFMDTVLLYFRSTF